MREGMEYARRWGARVFCALNTYPQPAGWKHWTATLDKAVDLGVDALILADMGLLAYAAEKYPQVPRHLSVQGSATSYEALRFYEREFGIKRAVLPRVLSMDQVRQVASASPVELEVLLLAACASWRRGGVICRRTLRMNPRIPVAPVRRRRRCVGRKVGIGWMQGLTAC